MDIATAIFVGGLCAAAFLLTITVRREFRTRERLRREYERALQHPRRKPFPSPAVSAPAKASIGPHRPALLPQGSESTHTGDH